MAKKKSANSIDESMRRGRRSIGAVLPKYARIFTAACMLFCFLMYREAKSRKFEEYNGLYMDKRSMLNKDYYYAGYSYADYQLPMNQGQQGSYYQMQPQGQIISGQQGQVRDSQGRPILPIYDTENAVEVISNSDSESLPIDSILFENDKEAESSLEPPQALLSSPASLQPVQAAQSVSAALAAAAANSILPLVPRPDGNSPADVGLNGQARTNISYPEMHDLKIHASMKEDLLDFYKIGANRKRQFDHGTEIPHKRYPELIIVGAKKCGTTALKIFMNYHPGFRDTPGEKHFFNRPSNWKKGFTWYKDQSPLTYSDEVTYEKTPDYFDRSFVPERIKQMNENVKIISILCDPVHRAYSHFLHAFAVQKNADTGNALPGFYWLEGHTEFNEVVRIAMRKILKGKLPDEVTEDQIRDSVREYFSLQDAPMEKRTFPLRIPDVILTGGLYSHHIKTFSKSIKMENMLLLDASELMDNPGKVMREVAEFVKLKPIINENHFYFDEEKGFYCMNPPADSERGSFCLAGDKGRSKNAQVDEETKRLIKLFYKPFLDNLTNEFTFKTYEHWDW